MKPYARQSGTRVVAIALSDLTSQPVDPQRPLIESINSPEQATMALSAPMPQGQRKALFIHHQAPNGQPDVYVAAFIDQNGALMETDPSDPLHKRLVERSMSGQVVLADPNLPLQRPGYGQNPYQAGTATPAGPGYRPAFGAPPPGMRQNEDIVLMRTDPSGNFADQGYPEMRSFGFDFSAAARAVAMNQGNPAGVKWTPFIRHKNPNGQKDVFEALEVDGQGRICRMNPGEPGYAAFIETKAGAPLAPLSVPALAPMQMDRFRRAQAGSQAPQAAGADPLDAYLRNGMKQ